MATVYVQFGSVGGGGNSVYAPITKAAQKITSSASSQQFAYVAEGGEYLRAASSGGDVSIAIGPSPTAISGAAGTHFILAGGVNDIGPLKTGDKVAVIDA